VPFLVIDPVSRNLIELKQGGTLPGIAPTILSALGLTQPHAMDGACITAGNAWQGRRRVLLIILDGWGIGSPDHTNPIHLAETPAWDALLRDNPNTLLQASGLFVGLQPDKPGNSEAGHMNIGAGRIIAQDDQRLDQAMKDGSFFSNKILVEAIRSAQQKSSSLHLIGLLTLKSSHGSIEYPLAVLKMAQQAGLQEVYLHLIFDGRSTTPGSAPVLLEELERQMQVIGAGQIVTGIGRELALDRDGNYARIQSAYEALVNGRGVLYSDVQEETV
jgi:2,3-bisphosphoglycerate-independent phosphoglycerate mutase